MKTFLFSVLTFLFLGFSIAHAESSLKLEGTCSGNLANGTPVVATFYSDFDGEAAVSKSAVTYSGGIEGLYTGKRTFKNAQDTYSFSDTKIIFADATGNTTGRLQYLEDGERPQSVELSCEVRDYEYVI